jgi:hypothetical protein
MVTFNRTKMLDVNNTPRHAIPSSKMIPYLLPSLRRLNQCVPFVVNWVTKQLTVGTIQKIKTNLVHRYQSSETEYSALSEVSKEGIFVKHVEDSMGHKICFPIIIKVDNDWSYLLSRQSYS